MDLARLMARLAAACVPQLGYLISKGGITTGTLLAEGLGLEAVQLEGQLLPGLSLVRPLLSGESPQCPPLPADVARDVVAGCWQRISRAADPHLPGESR